MTDRRRVLFTLALFLALSLLFCRRFFDLTNLESHCMTTGDPGLNAWALDWGTHALLTPGASFLDGNAFHPYPRSLALSEHMASLAALNVFLKPFGSTPWLGYNALVFLSFFASAVGGELLARELTGSWKAGLWGGVFWAFLFFRVHHMSHLQILSFEWIPFCVVALRRGLREPTLRHWGAFTVFALMQTLVSWYLAVITIFLLVIVLAWTVDRSALQRRTVILAAGSTVVCGGALVPLALAYAKTAAQSTLAGRMAEAAASGDLVHLRDYLFPPEATWIGSQIWLNPYAVWGENTLYIGYTAIALSLVGLAVWRDRRALGLGVTLVVVGFWLSKGFVSRELHVNLPLHALARVLPFLNGLRAAQRFSLLLYFGVLILSSFGVAHLERRVGARAGGAIVGACLALFLFEVFPVRLPYDGFRRHPFAYSVIDREAERLQRELGRHLVLAHYPIHHFDEDTPNDEASYLVGSTLGYPSIVNGYSGSAPVAWVDDMQIYERLPEPVAVERLRARGVDLVCLHPDLPAARRAAIVSALVGRGEALPVFQDDAGDVILQLRR